MEVPWVLLAAALLPLLPREYPREGRGRGQPWGGGRSGCRAAWARRLSVAELAAVGGGRSAPNPGAPQLAGPPGRCPPWPRR